VLGVPADGYLGHGSEACVYALGADRAVRVLHDGSDPGQIALNQALVRELAAGAPPFALPEVLEVGEIRGRFYAVERRLPGRPVLGELGGVEGPSRERLVEAHLAAALALGDLPLAGRDYFGDLVSPEPVRTASWREYLHAKAAAGLAAAGLRGDPARLAAALPEPASAGFVHLDAFAGNMLTDGERITAVLDIGPGCAAGDTRVAPVAAAVYLEAPEITPRATRRDVEVARGWLLAHDLLELLEPVRRWLAAYWGFAVDDPNVQRWCRSVFA
jgi:Ser/Thr protein kinase RdoA (MazF antagonist)